MTLARKWLALLLSFVLVVTGCPLGGVASALADEGVQNVEGTQDVPTFDSLSDPDLVAYLEDAVYARLIDDLVGSGDYVVEDVRACYVSKEYLDEVAYNAQANIYFGYTLEEVEEQFAGERFVFTLGDDGQTVVKAFEGYDDTYEQALRKVAVGGGVILLCVTVSVATAGVAPAVSMIFAVGGSSAAVAASSGGVISAAMSGIVTASNGGDRDEVLKAAASAGADGFMWGAVGGALTGGVSEAVALGSTSRATKAAAAAANSEKVSGLTMNEVAAMQRETKYPLSVIRKFRSVEEGKIYENAGLRTATVNGKKSLVRTIDWNRVDDRGRTNLERIKKGLNPIDESGNPYELHHIGQQDDGLFAVLTKSEHMQGGNNKILHPNGAASEVNHGASWAKTKKAFWKSVYEQQTGVSL